MRPGSSGPRQNLRLCRNQREPSFKLVKEISCHHHHQHCRDCYSAFKTIVIQVWSFDHHNLSIPFSQITKIVINVSNWKIISRRSRIKKNIYFDQGLPRSRWLVYHLVADMIETKMIRIQNATWWQIWSRPSWSVFRMPHCGRYDQDHDQDQYDQNATEWQIWSGSR